MNTREAIVVGSGPAGVACAAALLEKGIAVTLLDAGLALEPAVKKKVARLAAIPPPLWDAAAVSAIKGNIVPGKKGIPLKLLFGSDFPYRDAETLLRCRLENIGLRPSLALGGFSNVWGAAMLPYLDADMPDWPVNNAHLAQHYAAVARIAGLAGAHDDLEKFFPLFVENPPALKLSTQSRILRNNLEKHRDELATHGIFFGASRLAVQAAAGNGAPGCVYCGMCMYGCPWCCIYNSADTVARLQDNPAFRYQPGIIVDRVAESGGAAQITGRHMESGEPFHASTSRVYLAAGAISTTGILLRSLDAFDRPVSIKDSQYFLFPLLMGRKAKGMRHEPLHTLSQLFIEIFDPKVSPHTVHLQVYSYNDLIGGALRDSFGPVAGKIDALVREFEDRLMIVQGYLHSDFSSQINVTLSRGADANSSQLLLSPEINKATKPAVRRVVSKLLRQSLLMGAAPLPPMLQIAGPGRGFHSGGSFPMRAAPGKFETDTLGRPSGFTRIHAVDATVFPSIPATTITFSAMANAHRIGWESASLNR
ncbi:MAG: hypothetical protein WCD79_22400 [Chthoniobacteraceae bacterium]